MSYKSFVKPFSTLLVLFTYLFIVNYLVFSNDSKLISIVLITVCTFFIMLVLNSISKILLRGFIIFTIIVLLPYYIAIDQFEVVSYANISALYFTDFTESVSYLKVFSFTSLLKSCLIFLPLLCFFKIKIPKLKIKYSIFILATFLSFTTFKMFKSWQYFYRNMDELYLYREVFITPLRPVIKCLGYIYLVKKDLKEQADLQNIPTTWQIKDSNKDIRDEVIVFIIGESVRKDFLQIYNNKLSNTPFLDSINKIQFQNVLSYDAHTLQSLTNAFFEEKKGELFFPNNIITLAKSLELKTYWISNQGLVGVHDSGLSAMGKQSDYFHFLAKGNYVNAKKDEELIDIFKQKLGTNPSVYFLHTIGSHPTACDITDGEYSELILSEEISCYIESIRRTDQFIKQVYKELQKINKPFKLIYFSDHGLELTENNVLLHNDFYKQAYEVPLVIIDSSLKDTILINQQRNLKDFLYLYQEILGITTLNLDPKYNFISEDIAPNSATLNNNLIYHNLKDNSFKY